MLQKWCINNSVTSWRAEYQRDKQNLCKSFMPGLTLRLAWCSTIYGVGMERNKNEIMVVGDFIKVDYPECSIEAP